MLRKLVDFPSVLKKYEELQIANPEASKYWLNSETSKVMNVKKSSVYRALQLRKKLITKKIIESELFFPTETTTPLEATLSSPLDSSPALKMPQSFGVVAAEIKPEGEKIASEYAAKIPFSTPTVNVTASSSTGVIPPIQIIQHFDTLQIEKVMLSVINSRFEKNDVELISDEEAKAFHLAFEPFANKYAFVFAKYAIEVNMGLVLLNIILPRAEKLKKFGKNKISKRETRPAPQEVIPTPNVNTHDSEAAAAQSRYEAARRGFE